MLVPKLAVPTPEATKAGAVMGPATQASPVSATMRLRATKSTNAPNRKRGKTQVGIPDSHSQIQI